MIRPCLHCQKITDSDHPLCETCRRVSGFSDGDMQELEEIGWFDDDTEEEFNLNEEVGLE